MTHPASTEPVLLASGVSKSYPMGASVVQALQHADLRVERGERVCLMGRSGSGKTTLLNILGLIEEPDTGSLRIEGVETRPLSARRKSEIRARSMGYVFQTFNLIPVLTAWENVEYPMFLVGTPAAARKERVGRLLDSVGLGEHARHRPDELSGGQRQRVALARALANSPRVVLADELTSALDRTTSIEIMRLIRQLNESEGTTFLFSSHDDIVAEHSTRVVHLLDGSIQDAGHA